MSVKQFCTAYITLLSASLPSGKDDTLLFDGLLSPFLGSVVVGATFYASELSHRREIPPWLMY